MSSYTINYFDSTGRADVLKLIAEVGGVSYKFNGIPEDKWPAVKDSTKYGQLPYLCISDKLTLYQTMAIARFIAQESNLYPKDHIQATLSEEYVAALDELTNKFVTVYYAEGDQKTIEMQKYQEGPVHTILTALSKVIEENNGTLLCCGVTWADLILLDYLMALQMYGGSFASYPTMISFKERIESMDKVKEYLNSERNLKKL